MRVLESRLTDEYRASSSAAICSHVLALPQYQSADTVFCFVGTSHEINTRLILQDALEQGKRLCVPLCTGDGIMEARVLHSLEELIPGAYGILEPPVAAPSVSMDEIDLMLIPCVTCDRAGRRLGHGKGYYDRYLASYRGGTLLLCQEELLREEIPTEPRDMPVHWVMTERGLYEDGIPAPFV